MTRQRRAGLESDELQKAKGIRAFDHLLAPTPFVDLPDLELPRANFGCRELENSKSGFLCEGL